MYKYRIWSIEHDSWWKGNKQGYTDFIKESGLYTIYEANAICLDANIYGKLRETMVPVEED